eukprot:3272745-Rhodomonas_salina.3
MQAHPCRVQTVRGLCSLPFDFADQTSRSVRLSPYHRVPEAIVGYIRKVPCNAHLVAAPLVSLYRTCRSTVVGQWGLRHRGCGGASALCSPKTRGAGPPPAPHPSQRQETAVSVQFVKRNQPHESLVLAAASSVPRAAGLHTRAQSHVTNILERSPNSGHHHDTRAFNGTTWLPYARPAQRAPATPAAHTRSGRIEEAHPGRRRVGWSGDSRGGGGRLCTRCWQGISQRQPRRNRYEPMCELGAHVEAKLSARPRKGATRQEEDATRAVQELLALAFSSEVSSKILGAKSVMSDQADPDI